MEFYFCEILQWENYMMIMGWSVVVWGGRILTKRGHVSILFLKWSPVFRGVSTGQNSSKCTYNGFVL
jgi:hypothetical protein